MTLTAGQNDTVIDPANYTYFTLSKKLQMRLDLDMNAGYTIAFE